MITVASVLRSGGEYEPHHVFTLREAVARHLSVPHRFVCLSDMHVSGIEVIPLIHRWPGWWSKIELFRAGLLFGPVLYLDLDTWIMGSLDELAAYSGSWAMLQDFLFPERLASGVMLWTPGRDHPSIYERFLQKPEEIMRQLEGSGDQAWIQTAHPGADRIQDLYPGQVLSWKVHCARNGIPEGARLVCFHGRPRPWEVTMP